MSHSNCVRSFIVHRPGHVGSKTQGSDPPQFRGTDAWYDEQKVDTVRKVGQWTMIDLKASSTSGVAV